MDGRREWETKQGESNKDEQLLRGSKRGKATHEFKDRWRTRKVKKKLCERERETETETQTD